MGELIDFASYACAARERADFFEEDDFDRGLSISEGQEASAGQLSANHRSARSRRRTVIETEPRPKARKRRLSPKQRQLTLVKGRDSAAAYARANFNKASVVVMSAKSVKNPGKSRKSFPGVPVYDSGNVQTMNLAAILRFIESRLDELNLSAHKASLRAGKADAIRNIRRYVEKGRGGPTMATLGALEKALNVPNGTLSRIGSDLSAPSSSADGSVPAVTGNDIETLRAQLSVLLEQARALNQKIEGIQYAISILEVSLPAHRKKR